MLARPAAIAAMHVRDRLASRAIDGSAAARIVARGGPRNAHTASRFDRSPCSRRAFGMHASQWRRLRLSTELAEKAARDAGDLDYRFPEDAGPYSLRHTSIENLKAAGVPMDVVHTLAGHSNVQTTMAHYANGGPQVGSCSDSRQVVC